MLERPSWLFADLDGTLADTLPVAFRVYQRLADHAGFTPTAGEFAELNGPSLPEVVDFLVRRHRLKAEADALVREYRRLWVEGLVEVAAKPGALLLLEEARRRSIDVAIVTSGSAAFANRFLSKHGLSDRVRMVVSGDEVARSKPDPAIYLLALRRAQCAASSALALEDSVNGVTAAANAGIAVVGVTDGTPHSASREALVAAGAASVLAGLPELFLRVAN